MELQRIASHLIWFGTHVMDIGAITAFLYSMRERETILDIFEMCCGARLTYSYCRVGGLMADVPAGFEEKVREFIKIFPERLAEYNQSGNAQPDFYGSHH